MRDFGPMMLFVARRDLTSIQELLPRVFSRIASDTGSARHLQPLWEQVVGPGIARHTQVLALEQGSLMISTASTRWVNELAPREEELRQQLQNKLGAHSIKKLVFRLP
jgi:predicted nucleic acid-binding Zn ribbon protein